MLKVLVFGSRGFNNEAFMEERLDYYLQNKDPKELMFINGRASGADILAYNYALKNKIKTDSHYPRWKRYGKSAGFIRNKQMVAVADVAIGFWDQKSKGAKHTIDLCKKYDVPLKLVRYAYGYRALYNIAEFKKGQIFYPIENDSYLLKDTNQIFSKKELQVKRYLERYALPL